MWLLKGGVGVYYEVLVHMNPYCSYKFVVLDATDSVVASVVVVYTEAMLAEVNICLLLDLH